MNDNEAGRNNDIIPDLGLEKEGIILRNIPILSIFIVLILLLAGFNLYSLFERSAAKRSPVQKTEQKQKEFTREEVLEAYNKGDYATAIPGLENLTASNKDDVKLREMLASAYVLTGNNKRAVSEFKAILELKPDDPEILYKIGVVYEHMGNETDTAIGYLKLATQAAPDVTLFHAELARSYTKSKRYDDAVNEWKAVLNLQPDNDRTRANILAEIANIYILGNNSSQATRILAAGFEIDPDNQALNALKLKVEGMAPAQSESQQPEG